MLPSDEKIRVLTLIDSLGVSGGGERIAMELTKNLDRGRYTSTLCVSRWSPALAVTEAGATALDSLEEAGVDFLGLERESRLSLGPWAQLRRRLRGDRVDILHAHKFGSNFWGTIVGRWARVPVVVAHEHTWSYVGQPARRFADRRLISRYSDVFIAVSSEDRRRMIEIERVDPDKIRLIPNGMPPVPQLGAPGDLRGDLGIGDAPVIGAIATIRPQKGLDLLVEAAASVARDVPGLQLIIAGEGDASSLRTRAQRLGFADSLHLLGLRSDVATVIGAFDVAVSSSHYEGTPLAVMEYMEAGVPVVATSVGGVPELLDDGRCGLLVEPGNATALAEAVSKLLLDPARAGRIGAAGQLRRRREYGLETMVGRIETLYEELLDR